MDVLNHVGPCFFFVCARFPPLFRSSLPLVSDLHSTIPLCLTSFCFMFPFSNFFREWWVHFCFVYSWFFFFPRFVLFPPPHLLTQDQNVTEGFTGRPFFYTHFPRGPYPAVIFPCFSKLSFLDSFLPLCPVRFDPSKLSGVCSLAWHLDSRCTFGQAPLFFEAVSFRPFSLTSF